MPQDLNPVPDGKNRADIAERVRKTAANISKTRAPQPNQKSNDDLEKACSGTGNKISAVGTFTKGLKHDIFGRVERAALKSFVEALNQKHANDAQNLESPFPKVYTTGLPAEFNAPLFDPENGDSYFHPPKKGVRGWESPLAGHAFDLQGCDADATGMPPAPSVGSAELTAEMGEVYCAALLRDEAFTSWTEGSNAEKYAHTLSELSFFKNDAGLDDAAKKRRKARLKGDKLGVNALFRGSTPGAMVGPYISQFMLIGNNERMNPEPDGTALNGVAGQTRAARFGTTPASKSDTNQTTVAEDGYILYGIQGIPQKFKAHQAKVDHMTSWTAWSDVQNGANLKDVADRFETIDRFVTTPRDLATYVHYDALYQAYLNAVLILSGMGADTDIGFPEGGNQEKPHRDAFATYGGPHILSLVTEVATRALKAVRRQKFNIHLRSRPEAIAASLALAWTGGTSAKALGPFQKDCESMKDALMPILELIKAHNSTQNIASHTPNDTVDVPIDAQTNALLPMAFPEGSPMHAAYGAGHATVAGACVTVVKAFFEMFDTGDIVRGKNSIYDVVNKANGYPGTFPKELFGRELLLTQAGQPDDKPPGYNPLDSAFVPIPDGTRLEEWTVEDLTIQGELNKLAANISIGRNFAGVHYYTDYYESLRMGERIAVSILQEQMLTYREPVSMRFNSFDGDHIMIAGTGGSKGTNDAVVFVWDENGNGGTKTDFENWWNRHR